MTYISAEISAEMDVAMQAPSFYSESAANCRRLAMANADADARAVLLALAEGCDDLAIEAAACGIAPTLH
jgi:hypothetical protein